MFYFGARWYEAEVGRFVTKDKNLWGFGLTSFSPDDRRILLDENYSPLQILRETVLFATAQNYKNFHRYTYVGNNPINYGDLTGDIAWLPILVGMWVAYESGYAIYDIYLTYRTLQDPTTTRLEKGLTVGLLTISLIGPGGGYLTGDRIIKGFTKHGINRLIERGIKPQYILDAVRNPRRVTSRFDEIGRKTVTYHGKRAKVVLNEAGEVVTVTPQ